MSPRPVAVVTGASAGIGRSVASELARRGFDVAVLARGDAGLDGAAGDVEAEGGRALAITVDVADWGQVDAAADRVEAELGPIDVWVNNAMTTVFSWSWDVDPSEFRRATEVTYLGQVHGTLAALHRMRPRDRGRIVDVGSALSYVGIPLQSAYCGAKFASRGFFQSVRAELLHEGSNVTISMVHLPGVNTPQFDWCLSKLPRRPKPVPPVYEPDVAARAVADAVFDGRASKVLGSWNKVVVAAARISEAVATQYAARTGVGSQQGEEPTAPERPANLWHPVDGERDRGARGSFGRQTGGVLTRGFLGSLPGAVGDLGRSIGDAVRFGLGRGRRRAEMRAALATKTAATAGSPASRERVPV